MNIVYILQHQRPQNVTTGKKVYLQRAGNVRQGDPGRYRKGKHSAVTRQSGIRKATEDDHREDSVTEGENNKASRSQQDRITGSKARCWASLPHKKNEEDRADKLGLRRCAGVSAGREQETQQGHACVKSTTGDIIQVHNLK